MTTNECVPCRHCFGWECRRYPQVLTQPALTFDGKWYPQQFGFPLSGVRCGEFADKIDEVHP